MRQLATFVALVAAFSAAWFFVPKREQLPRADRNLVLVIACTLRADQTSLHSELGTTPTLAGWAEDGAHFTDVIAAAPWTRAASSALLTGKTPSALGLAEPAPGRNDRALPQSARTLAEALEEAGFVTLGATANPNLNDNFQFDQGFEAYEGLAGLWREDGVKVPGEEVNAAAARLLDAADPTKPTYLQLVYTDSHAPLDVSPDEIAVYQTPGLPPSIAGYRAMVSRLDQQLADLEDLLAERGLTRDNTTIALVADHGEGLGMPTHHGLGHGLYLYPSTLHVPFVLVGRRVPPGLVIDGLASGQDVAPTLAELVGVAFEGKSHASALSGEETGRDKTFAATWFRSARRGTVYTKEIACQKDFAGGVPAHPSKKKPPFPSACFKRSDRGFSQPLAIRSDLTEDLDAWFEREESTLRGASPEIGDVEDELSAALEALGYTGGD